MWPSLSSYLQYKSTDDGESKSPAPTMPGVAGTQRVAGVNYRRDEAVASPIRGARYRGRTIDDKAIGRTNLHSCLHNMSSSTSNGRRHHLRNATAEPDNTTILRGVIVGEGRSGKTTLIRRLRGEHPFQGGRQREQLGDRVGGDSVAVGGGKRNLMALIPWKLPARIHQKRHAAVAGCEEIIQLYVSEGKSFCYSDTEKTFQKQWVSVLQPQRGKRNDFVVWMIDPRMNQMMHFVREGLDILFPPTTRSDNGDGEKETQIDLNNAHPMLVQNMCILLNFRDLYAVGPNENEISLAAKVHRIVEQVFERHKKYDATPNPTILVYETSMKNCYGLSNLHSFISLPYLNHKEKELIRRAELARMQHAQWKRGLIETRVVQYEKFLEKIISTQMEQSLGHQEPEEEKENPQQCPRRQNELTSSKAHVQNGKKGNGISISTQLREKSVAINVSGLPKEDGCEGMAPSSPSYSSFTAGKRKSFTMTNLQPPLSEKALPAPTISDRKKLDLFFSEGKEDGSAVAEAGSVGDDSGNGGNDSDDGGFYIDVSGDRCSHMDTSCVSHKQTPGRNEGAKEQEEHQSDTIRNAQGNKIEGASDYRGRENITWPESNRHLTNAKHSSSEELEKQEKAHGAGCKVDEYSHSRTHDVEIKVHHVVPFNDPTPAYSPVTKEETEIKPAHGASEPDTPSLKSGGNSSAFLSNRKATCERAAGDKSCNEDFSEEPSGEQSPQDNSPNPFIRNEIKAGSQNGYEFVEAHEISSVDTGRQEAVESEDSRIGMNSPPLASFSNDSSTWVTREEGSHGGKTNTRIESGGIEEELIIDDTLFMVRSPKLCLPASSIPVQRKNVGGTLSKSTPVSSAALAAIETAKRESVRMMMAQVEPSVTISTKREKKGKTKKFEGDKKKKKKDRKERD